MTVQFNCSGCSHPIEVDDEFASQSVMCPYCNLVVTAPARSTLSESDTVGAPSARPLVSVPGDGPGVPAGPPPAAGYTAAAPPRRRFQSKHLAIAAISITLASLVLQAVGTSMWGFIFEEFGTPPDPTEFNKRGLEFITESGRTSEFVIGTGMICMSLLGFLGGFVLAIIAAVRNDGSVSPALKFISLGVCCFAVPMLMCLGV